MRVEGQVAVGHEVGVAGLRRISGVEVGAWATVASMASCARTREVPASYHPNSFLDVRFGVVRVSVARLSQHISAFAQALLDLLYQSGALCAVGLRDDTHSRRGFADLLAEIIY